MKETLDSNEVLCHPPFGTTALVTILPVPPPLPTPPPCELTYRALSLSLALCVWGGGGEGGVKHLQQYVRFIFSLQLVPF